MSELATFQQGVSGYTGCIDNYIDSANSANNYGNDLLRVNDLTKFILISFSNLGLVGKVVENAYISFNLYSGVAPTLYGYRVLKPWTELASCWDSWDTGKEWGAGGCGNADDDGEENSGDGEGADRKASAIITSKSVDGYWHSFGSGDAGFRALVQAWIDGGASPARGVIFVKSNAGDVIYYHSEHGATANHPKLVIEWSEPVAGGRVQAHIF